MSILTRKFLGRIQRLKKGSPDGEIARIADLQDLDPSLNLPGTPLPPPVFHESPGPWRNLTDGLSPSPSSGISASLPHASSTASTTFQSITLFPRSRAPTGSPAMHQTQTSTWAYSAYATNPFDINSNHINSRSRENSPSAAVVTLNATQSSAYSSVLFPLPDGSSRIPFLPGTPPQITTAASQSVAVATNPATNRTSDNIAIKNLDSDLPTYRTIPLLSYNLPTRSDIFRNRPLPDDPMAPPLSPNAPNAPNAPFRHPTNTLAEVPAHFPPPSEPPPSMIVRDILVESQSITRTQTSPLSDSRLDTAPNITNFHPLEHQILMEYIRFINDAHNRQFGGSTSRRKKIRERVSMKRGKKNKISPPLPSKWTVVKLETRKLELYTAILISFLMLGAAKWSTIGYSVLLHLLWATVIPMVVSAAGTSRRPNALAVPKKAASRVQQMYTHNRTRRIKRTIRSPGSHRRYSVDTEQEPIS